MLDFHIDYTLKDSCYNIFPINFEYHITNPDYQAYTAVQSITLVNAQLQERYKQTYYVSKE